MAGDNLAAGDLVMRESTTAATSGGAAGTNKLWLPLWEGDVQTAYDHFNLFEKLVTSKNLTGGFSWEFPVTGTVSLNPSWDAGEELLGGDATSKTFKVQLDPRPMAAHFECDNVDLLITQWDYRSNLGYQCGQTLANARDKQLVSALIAASVVPALSNDPRGTDFTDPSKAFQAPGVVNSATTLMTHATVDNDTALKILLEIENYQVNCQTYNIPVGPHFCAVPPKVFQTIRTLGVARQASELSNGMYPMFGASGNWGGVGMPINKGMNAMTDVLEYMGCAIVKTNHIPTTALAAADVGAAKYQLDCSNFTIMGLIWQPEAIASLSLQEMTSKSVEDVRRNTQFTVAYMHKGTGILRPELCKILIAVDSDHATSAYRVLNTRALLYTCINASNSALANGFAAEYAVTA